MTTEVTKQKSGWKVTLKQQMPALTEAMPTHIAADRFELIATAAIGSTPKLLQALAENPKTVWASIMAAATDGLLLDGREAALVPFWSSKTGTQCQYIPMIGGILKMMRQSGMVSSLSAQVVYENDEFTYELGDRESIFHKPAVNGPRGKPQLAYAVLHTTDGGIYREVMGRDEIMAVKKMSKAKNGPWSGPFETEMWRKTVLRRLAKRAPLSTDVVNLIQRDDGMYDLPGRAAVSDQRAELDLLTGDILEPEDGDITKTPSEDDKEVSTKPEAEGAAEGEEKVPEQMESPEGLSADLLKKWTLAYIETWESIRTPVVRAKWAALMAPAVNWLEQEAPDLFLAIENAWNADDGS